MTTHHRLILIIALGVTLAAGWLASQLHVDSDLRRLLPRDHEVVRHLEEIEQTFGSTGSVNVVIKGEPAAARHAFTSALAQRLGDHPLLRDVDYRLPSDFFAEHALYYLDDADIKALDARIQAWLHYEFCSEAPDNCLTEPDPGAPDALQTFVDAKREDALGRTGFSNFYEREGIDANVVLLHPTESAARLDFAKEITTQMRAITQEVFAAPASEWANTEITVNLVGPYVNKADEQEIVRRDTLRAGGFALAGVILILYLLLRSRRAVVILLVPLLVGVVCSLAATRVVVGDLNLMTSLISTVVMGAGIDVGIHFYLRVRLERGKHDDAEAIGRAFHGLIVPLLVASSTTVGAFLAMASSAFPAFREFGVISAMGVGFCLLSMVTVLPALACMMGVKVPEAPRAPRGGLALTHGLTARPGRVLAGLAVVSLVAGVGASAVKFEFNGRALQSDHTRETGDADIALISEIFGRDIHAGILVRPTLESTRDTLTRARGRREALAARGESVVAELFAAPDLLPDPAIDLHARRREITNLLDPETIAELEEIAGVEYRGPAPGDADEDDDDDDDWDDDPGETAADATPTTLEPPPSETAGTGDTDAGAAKREKKLTAEDASLLLEMLEAEPFTEADLPKVLLERVRTASGAYAVFAYPDFDAADMRKGVQFTEETRLYLDADDPGMFVGETTVYAAMLVMLRKEAPRVLLMAIVLVAVLVYWQVRSIRQTAMILLPLVLAFGWLLAIMAAIGLRFTLFNLPILPAILGIGVDNGVYLSDRIRRTRGQADGLLRSLRETGGAIAAATTTTAVGFAAFMVADSAGVRGIGAVAVLGILLAAIAAILTLPALASFRRSGR